MAFVSKCQFCGESFEWSSPSRKRKFCSKACARRGTPANRGRKKTGTVVACEWCGKEFYRRAWEARKGHGRFCSSPCRAAWQGRDGVDVTCQNCGKPFRCSPWWAQRRKYCSRACATEGQFTTGLERMHNGRRVKLAPGGAGYLQVWEPDHPEANTYNGWVFEHRFVAEQALGRRLRRDESVHHVNGVKDDNRPENLVVLKRGEHTKVTNNEQAARRRRERAELEEYRRLFGPLPAKED